MKAVVLVGGEATRLLPLTCNIPKAMVPVLNTPFLEHIISYLGQHHVESIILTQSHLASVIESYFGNGSHSGVKLSYTTEDTPLGTAGAVKNAERYLDETFLVLNGDIFTDLDITAIIDFHRERRAKATIALTPVEDPTGYGLIETDAGGRVTRFLEKPGWSEVTTNMINAGTYILEPEILANIPPQVNFSFEHQLFPLLLDQRELIYAYPSTTYWIDIGTPEKYLRLNRDLLSGMSIQHNFPADKEILIGDQSYIHPTAQIRGPILIGSKCTIGQRVKLTGPLVIGHGSTIMEDSVIEKSIIWGNVQLVQRVNLRNSIVANNSYLNTDSIINDSVLGDNVTVVSGCRVEPGSRIWPGSTVGTS